MKIIYFSAYIGESKIENKNEYINLNVFGKNIKKKNFFRKNLNALMEGIFLTRDLVSEPGNVLHPDEYARRLKSLTKDGLKVTVYDEKKLKKLGMNTLLGVGQGSIRGSYLVTMERRSSDAKSQLFKTKYFKY